MMVEISPTREEKLIYFRHKLQALFRGLKNDFSMTMDGQRIWYKLPYDSMKHLEILIYGSQRFARMCEASKWTKFIEIFMEHEDVNGDEEDNDEFCSFWFFIERERNSDLCLCCCLKVEGMDLQTLNGQEETSSLL